MPEPTLGQRRVRVEFNPGDDSAVARVKYAGAALIDAVNDAPGDLRLRRSR